MTKLHPQLKNDGIYRGELDLCHLLLMNERKFTWSILVPLLHAHHIVHLDKKEKTVITKQKIQSNEY